MDKKIRSIGAFIIASAIVWGAVMVGSSLALKGTECYGQIQNILVGGFLCHLILIWGPMTLLFRKTVNKSDDDPKG